MNFPYGPSADDGSGSFSSDPGTEPFVADFSEGLETGLYLALLELIDEGLIITGDEMILDVNSAACRLLERDYRDIAGKSLSVLFPSEKMFLQARERLFIQGEMRGSLQVSLPGGRVRTMRFVAAARLRPGIHALILSPDLLAETHAKDMETTAQPSASDKIWPRLAAALEQPVIVVDQFDRIVAVNAATVRVLKHERNELVGRALNELMKIDWPTEGQPPLARLSGENMPTTKARVLPGPKPRWRVLVLPPAMTTEPTSRPGPQKSRSEFFQRVFNHSPLPTFLCEGKTMRIFAANEAAIALYGYSRNELCSMSIRDLRTSECSNESLHERNLWRHHTRDGHRFEVEILAYPINPPEHPGAIVLMHDMPDRPLLTSRLYLPADIASAAAQAIDRHQLSLYFQPLVDIRDGSIRSGEALLRWRHPEIGLLPFRRFMDVVRNDSLVGRIGDWVLQAACRHAVQWSSMGEAPGVTVNIANEQLLRGDLPERVRQALAESGLQASRLELDFDESLLNEDRSTVAEAFGFLNKEGIKLAIDDFGRGSVPLIRLEHYPVHTLKLSPAFVPEEENGDAGKSVISAITGIAKAFSLAVLARGVKTRAQQNFMSAHGCHLQQGPLFGPPLSAEDFLGLIRSNQRQRAV